MLESEGPQCFVNSEFFKTKAMIGDPDTTGPRQRSNGNVGSLTEEEEEIIMG